MLLAAALAAGDASSTKPARRRQNLKTGSEEEDQTKDPKWIEFSISIYILVSFSHSFFFGVFRFECFLETGFRFS